MFFFRLARVILSLAEFLSFADLLDDLTRSVVDHLGAGFVELVLETFPEIVGIFSLGILVVKIKLFCLGRLLLRRDNTLVCFIVVLLLLMLDRAAR